MPATESPEPVERPAPQSGIPRMPVAAPRPDRPLAGLRVVDLSRLLPGPMCAWYLRGMGAEVIKVEQPGVGDYLRHMPPFGPDGLGLWFSALNAGCRSVALDLKRDAEALHPLLETADVLIEGFRPGVMERLGLGPAALRARHPRLIGVSISGFGADGPWAHLPGHDLGYVALTGALALGARPRGAPEVPGLQIADMAGGALTAALRVTGALLARAMGGGGAWLDVSMTEGALAWMAAPLAAAAGGAVDPPGGGALTGAAPNYGVYRCADGRHLAVGALEPQFLALLEDRTGVPVADLGEVLQTQTRDHWAGLLAEACCAPVLDLQEVLEHPLHRARGSITGAGPRARVCPPLPGPHAWVHAPAPALGADQALLGGG